MTTPDAASNAQGATEIYLLATKDAAGMLNVSDPRFFAEEEADLLKLAPFLRRVGTPKNIEVCCESVKQPHTPATIFYWEGANPDGLLVRAVEHMAVLGDKRVVFLALGDKNRIMPRESNLHDIFSTLVMDAEAAVAATPARKEIEFAACKSFAPVWNDRGSGAQMDGAFYRPVMAGHHPIGDIGVGDYNDPNGVRAVIVVKDLSGTATKAPVDFKPVWTDEGAGADQTGSIWEPIPPPGYVAMGCVAQNGYAKPSTAAVRCIRADLVKPANVGDQIWSDLGSGAQRAVTIFSSPLGTFVAVGNRTKPNTHACANEFR